ncbi:J domain-containing protein [Massilia horti]|uniref:J domain-containing protein n=1 Tax=Massilia horti TaxID=2562153 RepID=A0A4Y9STW0_9BURK|nr:J domain-containing protein [Massilia horti]TFW30130.1 J domain-containing protein [Massilia horti]
MAKIHTHYDNLKVARGAPQEVIRAAYKALSQKYHPDKNPGDEKAARIMAIVNTAYNTLSDPVRRKEHDEWIAAEEWEVEWLESTKAEDGRERTRGDAGWEAPPPPPRPRYRPLRDPKWWLGMTGCFVGGAAAAVFFLVEPPKVLPQALALSRSPQPAAAARPDELGADTAADGWARPAGQDKPPAPEIKALAVTQLIVPARAPDCETDLTALASPNGEPWPVQSGYLAGYPVGNLGDEMQVTVDNGANSSPIFVKIYDLDRRANVRHAFVEARGTLTIDKLAAGKYEVRYQNIIVAAGRGECVNGHRASLRPAASGQSGA